MTKILLPKLFLLLSGFFLTIIFFLIFSSPIQACNVCSGNTGWIRGRFYCCNSCDPDPSCPGNACRNTNGDCDLSCPASNGRFEFTYDCTPQCSQSDPAATTLIAPANGAAELHNDVTLSWNAISNWGEGCPTNPSYIVFYTTKLGASCPALPFPNAVNVGTSTSKTLNDLSWNTSYCWYVQTHNGARAANSAVREFRTASSPVFVGSGISSVPKCGNNISGNASINGTDNPITYYTDYSISGAPMSEMKEVSIGIVPNNVRNGNPISETALTSAAADYFAALVTINYNNLSQSQFKIVDTNNSPYYSPARSSGELTNSNNKASLLNINGQGSENTRVVLLNATTIRVYWQIRFEDGYGRAKNANIYSAAFRQLPSGNWTSSANSPAIDRAVARVGGWSVNTKPAQVSISNPAALNATDFQISWGFSDGFEVNSAKGYMWTDRAPLSLKRLSPGATTFSLTTNEPADNSNSNIDVNQSNLGIHTYRLPDTVEESIVINTKMTLNDSACNLVTDSGMGLGVSDGWIVTAMGDTFAPNFDMEIQNVALDPPIPGLNGYSYLSTYTAAVGDTTTRFATRVSKQSFVLEDYNDSNSVPPVISSKTSWYDFLFELAGQNSKVNTINLSRVPEGTKTHVSFGTTPFKTQHVLINGNLEIGKNVKCNTRSIIFVSGSLTINPDFTIEENSSARMGCMFIVKGDTIVTAGNTNTKSGNGGPPIDPEKCKILNRGNYDKCIKGLSTTGETNPYDVIQAFLIMDGDFKTSIDIGDGNYYEGLYVDGAVVSKTNELGRDLRSLNNSKQPSEVIVFDPRYSNLFSEELEIKSFSIRERDYVNQTIK